MTYHQSSGQCRSNSKEVMEGIELELLSVVGEERAQRVQFLLEAKQIKERSKVPWRDFCTFLRDILGRRIPFLKLNKNPPHSPGGGQIAELTELCKSSLSDSLLSFLAIKGVYCSKPTPTLLVRVFEQNSKNLDRSRLITEKYEYLGTR